jgi:hypothetical protein
VRSSWVVAAGLMLSASSCEDGDRAAPLRNELRQPSGLALAPSGRWLFVTGGNWDRQQTHGTLMAIDLEGVHAALAAADDSRCPGSRDGVRECAASSFIESRATVLMGSGLGNIAVDLPGGSSGTARLLVAQRAPAAIRWVDVLTGSDGLRFECGQDDRGVCNDRHAIVESSVNPDVRLPRDPSRVVIDTRGFRFAYVPHLFGGALSLVGLDGERGPSLRSVSGNFYRDDPFEDGVDMAGGFSVAQRACDLASPPEASRDCTRPVLFTSHRYWPGVREFSVAVGQQVVLAGATTSLDPINPDVVHSRPYMGDLAFEDPDIGEHLLVVQTTPGGLARVDTSLDDEGQPRLVVGATVAICGNPNLLQVYRSDGEESLALVTCFADDVLTVVGLSTFTVMRTIPLGEGPNEIVIDHARRQAYVANTRADTISIVSLDRRDPQFLTQWATIGGR